jgi:hypothetical protein
MSEQTKLTLDYLRQNLLNQLEKAREAIEELSDEQLKSIFGGIYLGNVPIRENMPMSHVGGGLPSRS